MANRIILLGPARDGEKRAPALEMNALEADALHSAGLVSIRLTQYSGDLANATVLSLSDRYIADHGGDADAAWAKIDEFLGLWRTVRRVGVKVPVPLWNGGARRYTAEGRKMIPEPGDLARVLEPIKLGSRKATIPADQNGLVEDVSDDDKIVTFKWRDAAGTHIIALTVDDIEVVP